MGGSGRRGFDPPGHFAAFFHTLRWKYPTATDPSLFQTPFRAGIEIDAYQMELLRNALRLPQVNFFIAGDSGLGVRDLGGSRPPEYGRPAEIRWFSEEGPIGTLTMSGNPVTGASR